jgi:tetratricopeptide (TPR) repeat protein
MKKLLIITASLVTSMVLGCGVLGVNTTNDGKDAKTGTGTRTNKDTGKTAAKRTAAAPASETAGPIQPPAASNDNEATTEPPTPSNDNEATEEPPVGEEGGLPIEQIRQMIENKVREQLTKSDAIKQAVATHIKEMLKEHDAAVEKEITAKLDKQMKELRSGLAKLSEDKVSRESLEAVKDSIKELTSIPPVNVADIQKKAIEAAREEIKNASPASAAVPSEKLKELDDKNVELAGKIGELEKKAEKTPQAGAQTQTPRDDEFAIPGVGIAAGFAVLLAISAFLFLRARGMKNAASDAVTRVTEMESRVRDLDRRLKDAAITNQKITKRLSRVETMPAATAGASRRYKLSQEMLNQMLSDNEKRVKHLFTIGESFLEMEDCETAIEWFDSCLEADPKFAPAWVEKGIALAKLQEYDEAMKTLYNATKLDGQAARAWYNIACVATLKGDRGIMFKAMKEAVALDAAAMDRFRHDKLFAQFYNDPQFLQIVG